jgi:hypothetical protein
MVRLGIESVPGVPEPLPTWEGAACERGHGLGTGVPGVPALSNSLSPRPAGKSGCNTLEAKLRAPRVTAALWESRRAISGPLGAVIRGLSRMFKVGLTCCSYSINRTDSADSQAECAGSIPVIRSNQKARSEAAFEAWPLPSRGPDGPPDRVGAS